MQKHRLAAIKRNEKIAFTKEKFNNTFSKCIASADKKNAFLNFALFKQQKYTVNLSNYTYYTIIWFE